MNKKELSECASEDNSGRVFHAMRLTFVKYAPIVFLALCILKMFQLPTLINAAFVDRSVYALGGAILAVLLFHTKEPSS